MLSKELELPRSMTKYRERKTILKSIYNISIHGVGRLETNVLKDVDDLESVVIQSRFNES